MLPKVKVALKNFMKFTGKHLYWSLSSLKVAGCLQIFQNFQRSLFHVAAENTTLKATKTVNQKKHKYILKLKFYLKSYFAAYFLKTILNKASLIFPFSFPCRFITLIKKRFQYVKCFSQVAAKHTTNIFQIKKIVMLKTRKWKSVKHSI